MNETPSESTIVSPGRRRRYALHLGGLTSIAISQPLFDLLARHQEFLVAHQLTSAEIAILAGLLSWGLAATAALPVIAADLVARGLGNLLYGAGVLTLASTIVLQVLRGLPAPAYVHFAVALTAGSLLAFSLVSLDSAGTLRQAVASFFGLLAAALVICPAYFLFTQPIAGLLLVETAPKTASAPKVTATTPIVMVVFDELPLASLLERERRIDARSYPAFAELAGGSHWFRNATTVAYQTTLAIPPIVTGRYPSHREATASAYPESLFTWLGTSYQMNVIETVTQLCPTDVCGEGLLLTTSFERLRATLSDLAVVYPHLVLPPALTTGLPDVTSTWRDFLGNGGGAGRDRADETHWRSQGDVGWVFERFLDSIEPPVQPTLSFLHVNLPHLPWKYFPSGREYGPLDMARPPGLEGATWRDDEWAVLQGYQRYLLQLGYADRLLGRLLKKLRDTGVYDPALVVVVADHGASFQPGRYRRVPDAHTAADIFLVPLFVKVPFQKKGRVTDRAVETIDILPTIAEALETNLPWEVDGRSLLAEPDGRRQRHVVREVAGQPKRRPLRGASLDLLDAAVERRLTTFGGGLFDVGPFRELLGRELVGQAVPIGAPSSLEVEVEEPSAFEDVDPQGAYLPARISGYVEADKGSPRPYHLAVALNGVLRSVTRSYEGRGKELFSAMLPESSFEEGFNQLDVFEILEGEAGPVLAPISIRSVRYSLERGANASIAGVALSDGRRFPVEARGLRGEVRFLGAVFSGWAADIDRGRRADLVLLFQDDKFVARIAPRLGSPELAEEHGKSGLEEAGFKLVVPFARTGRPEASRLTFLAVLDGKAGVLSYE